MRTPRVKWLRILHASLRIQLRHKLRTALALLGIILGAAAVVLMVGIARGGRQAILDQLEALGTNVLIVSAGAQRIVGGRAREPGKVTTLRLRDGKALAGEIRDIVSWAAVQNARLPVKYGPLTKLSLVVGTTPEYFQIRNLEVEHGRWFEPEEVTGAQRVAIIGKAVARDLFGGDHPIGELIKVDRIHFRIIGVMAEQGQVLGAATEDDRVYVPLTAALRRLLNVSHLDSIVLQVSTQERMDEVARITTWVMREQHRLRPPRKDDFTVLNQKELIDVELEASQRLYFLTSAIAGVSLLVGGIGILAIMTMAVRERTREIGVRRALGAKRRDVFWQFVAESALLSVLGGLLGVAMGLGGVEVASHFADYQAELYWPVVAFAFCFAAFAGILFGIYPSVRAARLQPISALRYE
ncbi:MAG: ABC transporter permease [Acidobacteriota bacterium]